MCVYTINCIHMYRGTVPGKVLKLQNSCCFKYLFIWLFSFVVFNDLISGQCCVTLKSYLLHDNITDIKMSHVAMLPTENFLEYFCVCQK